MYSDFFNYVVFAFILVFITEYYSMNYFATSLKIVHFSLASVLSIQFLGYGLA